MSDDDTTLEAITRAVTEVVLAQTGRTWQPGPDDALFGSRGLQEIHATPLSLAIQEATGASLRAEDITAQGLRTVRAICALVEARPASE